MKKIKLIFSLVVLLAVMIRCSVPDGISQDLTLDKTLAPTGFEALIDITTDNSGDVTFTPTAVGAATYSIYFGDGTANPALVQFGSKVIHKFKEGNYTVKVVANGLNGNNIEKTYPLSIVYRIPESLTATFTKKIHNLKVKASALYAASYLVYFGDAGAAEVGTPLANAEEISHDYAVAGIYNIKVIALSGGLAKTEKIIAVTIYDAFEFPITFESPLVVYSFAVTGGFTYSKVANPNISGINTSATVGRFNKVVGQAAGSDSTSKFDNPIDFSTGNKVKVLVYNPSASNIGKKVTLELGSPGLFATIKVALTKSGVWEELVFDYSTISPAIPGTTKFTQMVIRFNDTSLGRSGETFYLDEFRLTN